MEMHLYLALMMRAVKLIKILEQCYTRSLGTDDDEEQLNMETFLRRKDLKGHWEANGSQNKTFILALSSSQLIILQPCSDNKWAKIKSRR